MQDSRDPNAHTHTHTISTLPPAPWHTTMHSNKNMRALPQALLSLLPSFPPFVPPSLPLKSCSTKSSDRGVRMGKGGLVSHVFFGLREVMMPFASPLSYLALPLSTLPSPPFLLLLSSCSRSNSWRALSPPFHLLSGQGSGLRPHLPSPHLGSLPLLQFNPWKV